MKSILLIGAAIYLGMGAYLYVLQRSFIYFPVAAAATNLKHRSFENEGHEIKVAVINEHQEKALIYFGGNAENVEHNSDEYSALFDDYTIYLVKYRGFGGSDGFPTEAGLYSDALHIHDELKREHAAIAIIGRSLGSAVATFVASERAIDKLVLVTPFDSVQRVAQSRYPIYPMEWLLKDKHDSYSRAKNIQAPTLILAAELDRVIELQHTERLIEGFESDVFYRVIKGTDHRTISSNPIYQAALAEFL